MRKLCFTVTLLLLTTGPAVAQMHGGKTFEVPLRVHDGRLIVSVSTPDGEALDFAVSVGTPTLISESLAERLGEQPELTMGGVRVVTDEGYTIPGDQLTFGDLVVHGMVGPDTLNQYDILIDVPGGRLLLKEFGRTVEWPGMKMSEPIRMQVYHGMVFSLELELDGRPYRATLDLGAPINVVNEAVGSQLHLSEEATGTMTLGGQSFADMPVRVRDEPSFERWDPDNKGFVIVGAPVAWDCAISVSWVHRELRTCIR
jgi:hypothetical protein